MPFHLSVQSLNQKLGPGEICSIPEPARRQKLPADLLPRPPVELPQTPGGVADDGSGWKGRDVLGSRRSALHNRAAGSKR